MAVSSYERFTQKDGKEIIKVYLENTKLFKNRYFYTSIPSEEVCNNNLGSTRSEVEARVEALLDDSIYNWGMHLDKRINREYIEGYKKPQSTSSGLMFSRELYSTYFNKPVSGNITCKNRVSFDCTDDNLNVAGMSQADLNSPSMGYQVSSSGAFYTCINVDAANTRQDFGENYNNISGALTGSYVKTEYDACSTQYDFEEAQVKKILGSQAYVYNILNDFLGYEDILDKVRTGIITDEDAKLELLDVPRKDGYTVRTNAWYYYRYNLVDFFKAHNIPVPEFTTDKDEYMVDVVTGQRLCPFSK